MISGLDRCFPILLVANKQVKVRVDKNTENVWKFERNAHYGVIVGMY